MLQVTGPMARQVCQELAAAPIPSQVKLCPYVEKEPAIWFHLIKAQFIVAGIQSQKIKYANALANLAKKIPPGYFGYSRCLQRARSPF
jgi:hypothetical protein